MDEQTTQAGPMLNTSFEIIEGSLLQKANGPSVYRPAYSCSSMKHALKQQARRRRRNTAIASGNSPPITRVSMKPVGTPAAISPQGFVLNDLSSYDQTTKKVSRPNEFKTEGFNAAETKSSGIINEKPKCSRTEIKHTKDISSNIVKVSTITQSSVRSSMRLAHTYAQSACSSGLQVTQSSSTPTASCSVSSNGSATTVTQANKSLRVCPPQSSPSARDSQSFSMTLMQTYLAGVPGFKPRKRSQRKLSTSAQLAQMKEGSIDLETPDSLLVGFNVKSLINKYSYGLLPNEYQSKLAQLLPRVDIADAVDNPLQLTSNWLNNEFLARACESWRVRLGEGDFTHENQLKLKTDSEKEKSKIDPWKVIHFEPVWGMKQQAGEPSKPEVKPEQSVILNSPPEPTYNENIQSKFTDEHLDKLSKIVLTISKKIEKKLKTECTHDTTRDEDEPELTQICLNCCNDRNSIVNEGLVCNCTSRSPQLAEKRKAEYSEIEAKRFCSSTSSNLVSVPSYSEVSSSCLSPMFETPPNIAVSYVNSSLSDTLTTVCNKVIQPLTNASLDITEVIPPAVEVSTNNNTSLIKMESPQPSSSLPMEARLPSVTLRKPPRVVSQVLSNVNTVTLRVGRSPRSGSVNIQRSYEIVQAVIDNSPNRDQLKAQLKRPAELLAENVIRSPLKASAETVSRVGNVWNERILTQKKGIKIIGSVGQPERNKLVTIAPHIFQSLSLPGSSSKNVVSLSSTEVARELAPMPVYQPGISVNSVSINPVTTNKQSVDGGAQSNGTVLMKSNLNNSVSVSKIASNDGANVYKYGRPLLVAVSVVDRHLTSQVITVSGSDGRRKILLNNSPSNTPQTNLVQSQVNQGSPITWHPPSPITILRKPSDKPGFMQRVSVSNLQFVRIPSNTEKSDAPRASSVPPVATSLTSITPRPNSVGPRIIIPSSNPNILNIGRIASNPFLYANNPNPSLDSQQFSTLRENVQQFTSDIMPTGESEEEIASDVGDAPLIEAEVESVESADETLNKKNSEVQSPSSDNDCFQENYVYESQETFPETPSKGHENTPEAYSDESSFSTSSRTGNYIFAAHPGSESSEQEDLEQHSAEQYESMEKSECETVYHQINSEDAAPYSTEEQQEENIDTSVTAEDQSAYCETPYDNHLSNEQETENMLGIYEDVTVSEPQEYAKPPAQYNTPENQTPQQDQMIRAYSRAAYKVDGRPVHNFSGNAVQVVNRPFVQSGHYVNVNHVQPMYNREVKTPNMVSFADSNANQTRNVNNNQMFSSPQMFHKMNNTFCGNSLSGGQGIKGSFAAQKAKSGDSSSTDEGCPCNMQAMVMCLNCGAFCHHDCISSTRLCVTCFIR